MNLLVINNTRFGVFSKYIKLFSSPVLISHKKATSNSASSLCLTLQNCKYVRSSPSNTLITDTYYLSQLIHMSIYLGENFFFSVAWFTSGLMNKCVKVNLRHYNFITRKIKRGWNQPRWELEIWTSRILHVMPTVIFPTAPAHFSKNSQKFRCPP